jgi:hypothetical protein
MKSVSHFLGLLILVACALSTSCVSNKKMKAATAHIEQLKKDSIATHHKLNEKNVVVVKNKTSVDTAQKVAIIPKTDIVQPFPPIAVANVFNTDYPSASEVIWTKEMPLLKKENINTRDYRVTFVFEKNKKSVIYSEKGKVIETKEQILPDQLPPNIYSAIKKKYPDFIIVSASTLKSLKINGSYTVVISNSTRTDEKELILMENGTFVE